MAKVSIPAVKSLFQTGDRPTQENYVDLIDTVSSQATDLGSSWCCCCCFRPGVAADGYPAGQLCYLYSTQTC